MTDHYLCAVLFLGGRGPVKVLAERSLYACTITEELLKRKRIEISIIITSGILERTFFCGL